MGRPKPLIEVGGRPLIERVVAALVEGGARPVVVVAPPVDDPASEPSASAARRAGAVVVVPPARPADMRSSIELAIAEIRRLGPPPDGLIVAPGDSPKLDAAIVRRLADAWRARPGEIHVPTSGGRRGHPLVLPWLVVEAIAGLPADVGVNALLDGNTAIVRETPFDGDAVLCDLDTPEDLQRIVGLRTVRLFAIARQLAGAAEVSVALPPSATVADLRRALGDQHPALANLVDRVRIAVGDEYAEDPLVIPPSAPIAVIPPVSGGGR